MATGLNLSQAILSHAIKPQIVWWRKQTTVHIGIQKCSPTLFLIVFSMKKSFLNCIEGVTGPLCESCDYDNKFENGKFGKLPNFKCI